MKILIEEIYFENVFPTRGNLEKESKPLKIFKWVQYKLIVPTSDFIIGLFEYMMRTKWFIIIFIALFVRMDGIALICDFITIFLYVPISFDPGAIYQTVLMLFVTFWPILMMIPKIFILYVVYLILDHIRVKKAENILYKHENYNEGFYSSTGTVITVTAPMEAGKTTLITDMTLIGERKIRKDALAIMQEKHLLFPDFPFSKFEKDLDKRIISGEILTHTHIKKYVKNVIKKNFPEKNTLYGYDGHFDIDVGLGLTNLFTAISDYAQAYFLYTRVNPLSVANYSIEFRYDFVNNGHFRYYYGDFFNDDDFISRRSHIVDHNDYRLGKKMYPLSPVVHGHGGVVITLTEFGKDRGNVIKNRQHEARDEEANPLNDLMAEYQKLVRSACTISHKNMNKFITDEQRLEDINAEQRNISETQIFIEPQAEEKNALVMFWAEPVIFHKIVTGYLDIYFEKYRPKRSDKTLLFYLWGWLAFYCNLYLLKRYNRFGYKILRLRVKETVLDDKPKDTQKYFIQFRKIYNRHFRTDPWAKFYDDLNVLANVNIDEWAMYKELTADTQELQSQNSYFFKRLMLITKTLKGGE